VADRREAANGDEVWLAVWLQRARDVGNMNFSVTYDSAVVQPAGEVVKGNLLGSALFEANPRDEIKIGFAGQRGVSGDGTVAQIRFRVVGRPGTSSPIKLTVGRADAARGGALSVATRDGRIDVIREEDRKAGDFDGDGRITLADALAALKMSVDLIPDDLRADADRDKAVTSNDARILFQEVLER
jgi:hypothetical protein